MKNSIHPTLLDFAIMGLLQNQSLSGYRVRKIFEETALGNYSSSPGSIYPALKRLQKFALVENTIDSSTSKLQFKITSDGINILRKWLIQPLTKKDVEKNMDEVFLRFGFMDVLATRKQKIKFLESLQDHLDIYISELQSFHKMEAKTMPLHGRLAF